MLVEPVASEEHAPRSALRLDTPHDPARRGTVALGLDGGANTRPPPFQWPPGGVWLMPGPSRLLPDGTWGVSVRRIESEEPSTRRKSRHEPAPFGTRSSSVPVPLRRTGSSGECTSSESSGTVGPIFFREGSRSHLRNGFVQPLVVVVLDEASEGLHPRSPFAVHPVGTVPPLKRERRCGRLEPSWLPPCTWACDCLGRFSSPVTSSTLRCVGFAPPGERLAQTLPVDHRDRQPGSCRSLAGSCSYSRIADLLVLSPFLAAHSPSDS